MCLSNPLNKEEFEVKLASLPDEIEVVKLAFSRNGYFYSLCRGFIYIDGINEAQGLDKDLKEAGFYSYLKPTYMALSRWGFEHKLTCKIKKDWILEIGRDEVDENSLIVRTTHIEIPKYPSTSVNPKDNKNVPRV